MAKGPEKSARGWKSIKLRKRPEEEITIPQGTRPEPGVSNKVDSEVHQQEKHSKISTKSARYTKQDGAAQTTKLKKSMHEFIGQQINTDGCEEDLRTAFVGNLPPFTTKRALKNFFASCGEIESVRLRSSTKYFHLRRPNSRDATYKQHENASSIFGYIKFKESISVQNAVQKNGALLNENIIRVDACSGDQMFSPLQSVFIGNIHHQADENMVYKFFTENGLIAVAVRLVRDSTTGKCRGFGFVLFTDSHLVKEALRLNGKDLNGRPIRITKISSSSSKKSFRMKSTKSKEKNSWEGTRSRPVSSLKNLPRKIRKLA